MIDGFYRITFTGTAGSGFGMLVFRAGVIAGADVAGALFDGAYSDQTNPGMVDFKVVMTLPAGATPVQTGIPLITPLSLPIGGSIRESEIGGNTPTLLQTSLGPVNVLFNKIRDIS